MSHVLSYILIFSIIEIGGARKGLRIIGGTDADEDKYEYIVRLVYQLRIHVLGLSKNGYTCTGAVLNPIWTLTAAHCVVKETISNAKVSILYVIQFNPKNHTWTPETMRQVISVIRHPSYRKTIASRRCDIALLKTTEIPLKQYARLSALDFMTLVGQEVTMFGFGIAYSSGMVNDTMTLKIPLQTIDAIVIKCSYKILEALKPAMCIARRCGKSAALCPGDSGGPMLHSSGIVGVNSIAGIDRDPMKFCRLKNTKSNHDVGSLTPVSPFVDWVSDTIGTN